jgi:DNA-binding beta-propeller fold protein YncE
MNRSGFGCSASRWALILLWSMPGLCVAAPAEDPAPGPALFYPALPEVPRLQYLTKFSSPLDLGGKSSGFRNFVFGGADAEADLVSKPYGLAIHEGAIYVVDTRGGGYGVFDLKNRSTRVVRGSGASQMPKPINIAIDTDGTRYVTDTAREQVLVFDRDDNYLKAFGKKGEFKPVDVVIAGDRLYITDILHHQIHALDKRTGEILLTIGESGSGDGQMFHPTNLALAPDGTLYVSDTTNFRIQSFTPDGESLGSIGGVGLSVGEFARPKGIAISRDEHLYVVDAAFQNVQILETDGTPLLFFGEASSGPGGLNLPTVVKIDYDNIEYFEQYTHPDFEIEYLVLVANQFGANKIVVFGFGLLRD